MAETCGKHEYIDGPCTMSGDLPIPGEQWQGSGFRDDMITASDGADRIPTAAAEQQMEHENFAGNNRFLAMFP